MTNTKKQIDEQTRSKTVLKYIQDKVDSLCLPEYMRVELLYILSHLNIYKLTNLKANLKHLITMLKKMHKQHISFEKKIQTQIQHYFHHEHQTFANKIKTLINLHISELAHTSQDKHLHSKTSSLTGSLKKYHTTTGIDHKSKKIYTQTSDL